METKNLVTDMWMAFDSYGAENKDRYKDSPKVISATAFNKSPREVIANIRKALGTLDPRSYPGESTYPPVYSKIGTAIHSSIEDIIKNHKQEALTALGYSDDFADSLDIVCEKRYTTKEPINGWTITGKVDYIINGTLHDIKTVSSYAFDNDLRVDDYILQASIYKWLSAGEIKGDTFFLDFIIRDGYSKEVKNNIQVVEYEFLPVEEVIKILDEKTKLLNEHWDTLDVAHIPCCENPDEEIIKYKYFTTEDGFLKGKRAYRTFDTFEEAQAFSDERVNSGKPAGYIHTDITIKEGYKCPYCLVEPTTDAELPTHLIL